MILTTYVAAMAFAYAIRAEGLERYRFSTIGKRRIKREFWAFGRWATAVAFVPLAVNRAADRAGTNKGEK